MSAARTPESRSPFNARALLQTRSLRDLQVPPPPPKSSARDKSRRRVMQVNGPYVVPEVCPPIPGIGEPIRPELVQTPYVRSQSPAASIQVSPFIAATRPSFESDPSQSISPYARSKTRRKAQSSSDARVDKRTMHPATDRETPFPRGEPAYELRDPPIDPRKTRRYCSDFGLGRDELNPPIVARSSPPSPSVPDNSSLASTPLAMYTETETDSDISSVHHALEFSFPQPPSIDESLHLRRMHSLSDVQFRGD
ncbi:hypothetical protein FPV67DRAFT_1668097 [Lyophyllum atratum]|nr:hypothetical protein FPV67DRAFT_1668097 [Lyophyllum atratum]